MAITVSSINPKNAGSEKRVDCVVAFGTYSNTGNQDTTGELLLPATVGMTGFSRVVVNQESGYQIEVLYSQSGPAVSYPTPIRFRVLQSAGGAGGNTSNTSGGTPSGTINAQSFSGAALAGHTHVFSGNALVGHSHAFAGNALAGHTHTFTGNASSNHTHQFVPQQIANKAVVANVANIDVVGLHPPIVQAVYATVGGTTGSCTILPPGAPIATGQVEYDWGTGNLTFFAGDAVTECNVSWLGVVTTSNGSIVPTGTIDSVSAGTPAGTIDSVSAGIPGGTNASVSAGTPAGTVQQAVFSGDVLPTHNHTYGGGGGGAVEVPNGTDLSASLGAVQIICYGV